MIRSNSLPKQESKLIGLYEPTFPGSFPGSFPGFNIGITEDNFHDSGKSPVAKL